jgi:hypothetical protein
MTHNKTVDNEHIWGAVELIRAKARNRLAHLQELQSATLLAKPGVVEVIQPLADEIEEVARIQRLTDGAWSELHDNPASEPAP